MTAQAQAAPIEDRCEECGVAESELPSDGADFLCGCDNCGRIVCEECVMYGLCRECDIDRLLEDNDGQDA